MGAAWGYQRPRNMMISQRESYEKYGTNGMAGQLKAITESEAQK